MRLLSTVMVTALLTGPVAAAEPTGALKKIQDANRIVLGVRDSAPPFMLGEGGEIVGYTTDLCNVVVEAVRRDLGVPDLAVETASVTSSTRIPLIANGTIDLDCGSTTNNPERQKQVSFTNAHFVARSRFVAKKALDLKSLDDMKGEAVVSGADFVNIVQLNELNAERGLGIRVMTARDVVAAFLLVEADRAAAFVRDDVQLSILIVQSKDPQAYAIGEDALALPEPDGIVPIEGDAPFKQVVDRTTAELYGTPRIGEIYTKWFLSPVPPRGIDDAFPMPPALKYAFAHPTDSADPAAYVP